ncbi:MAG: SPOR domain-containing protein [Pseudomonadota bacterium]
MPSQPSISDEEIQLRRRARRRLIGAIALVAAMVATLPMVLDSEPKPVAQDIAINIPSQQTGGFASRIVPAAKTTPPPAPAKPVPAAPSQAPAAAPPAAPSAVQAATAEKAPAAKSAATGQGSPAEQKEPKPEKAQGAAAAAEPKQAHGNFVVLLGAFASKPNATQRQAKLKELGVKYYVETLKTPAGEKIGVRAGPFTTRHEAEQLRDKLKASGIPDGIVAEKK